MTRLALIAWWLVILSGPDGRAISPLVETRDECEQTRAWVLKGHSGYDALCMPAAREMTTVPVRPNGR